MKKIYLIIAAISFVLTFSACRRNDINQIDTQPPSPPTNLFIVNGDNQVEISWNISPERDVAGYNIYYAYSYNGKYTLLGATSNNYFIDYGAKNGNTYFYAVSAYDNNGNESELSLDNVNSTPRPEGFSQTVFDYRNFPNTGGFSFTSYSDVPYNDSTVDFYFENYNGTFYIDVLKDSDIQDMGPTHNISEVQYAPASGWSSTKDAVAIPGHTYVIWTWDNRYAKIRVYSITSERMVFDWAFQTVKGNTQLKIKNVPSKRNAINESDFIRH